MIDYEDRKKRELINLKKFLNKTNEVNDKLSFVKEYKKQKIENELYEITRKNYTIIPNYDYSYERFDGIITNSFFEKNFYKGSDKYNVQKTIFTNCGMSSITSILLSLTKILKFHIDISDECYFETYRLCSIFNNTSENKVLYMDTIEDDFKFNISDNIANYKLVIVDTTCFLPNQFENIIEKISSFSIPIILLRSHTKLDLLGTEYSHIGSTTYLYNEKDEEFINEIIKNQKLFLGITGSYLKIIDYPNFMLDNNIISLNYERINNIKNNNILLSKLSFNKFYIPNHNLFCIYKTIIKNKTIQELREYLKSVFYDDDLIYYSVSFGLDNTAIDVYNGEKEDEFTFRISIGDHPSSDIERIYLKINSVLCDLEK